jgi:hypothetical protein
VPGHQHAARRAYPHRLLVLLRVRHYPLGLPLGPPRPLLVQVVGIDRVHGIGHIPVNRGLQAHEQAGA